MTRRLLALASLVVAVAFTLPASASVLATTLRAEVGPGYEISLKNADGTAVTQLPPGDYTIEVNDRADIHNFHLNGAGVDRFTPVEWTGSDIWNVTLAAGTYDYFCDPHADEMHGSFTVGTAAPPPPGEYPPSPAPAPSPAPPAASPPAPSPPPPSPSPAAAVDGTLTGNVGPGFVISLKDATGATVSHLDRGTYTINVKDQGTIHNFHLTGPGVDQTTDVDGTGDFTWTVTLTDGAYTYQCDPHEATMHGSFTVGTVTSPPPAPPPPPVSPPPPPPAGSGKLAKLAGSVGPGFVIHLTKSGGGKLSSTKAASYLVTIRDLSASHNFHLFGPGVDKKTGVAFRGTVSWKVKLQRGKVYRYQCDPHKSVMKGSFKAT